MVLKAASRTYAKGQGDGSLLDGDRIVTNNLDFTIDGVSIVPFSPVIRLNGYSQWYMWRRRLLIGDTLASSYGEHMGDLLRSRLPSRRNAEHAQRVFNTIHSSPLPSQHRSRPLQPPQPQANGTAPAGSKAASWQPKRQVRIAA